MTMEFITQQLYDATQQRRVCRLQIKDEPGERTIHPYGICQTSRNKITIVCLQVDGFSANKKLPSYRNLSLENCESVELLDLRFIVQSSFDPEDSVYKDWVFHV